MADFAKPLSELQRIDVAAVPTPGKGLSLDHAGNLPAGTVVVNGQKLTVLDGAGDSSFLKLASTGDFAIAAGAATLAFSAGVKSATLTITHGLGRIPLYVVATAAGLMTVVSGPVVAVGALGATTFQMVGYDVDSTARTGFVTAYWFAIG